MKLLSEEEINQGLSGLPGWVRDGSQISKTFAFDDFVGSVTFVNRVAELAEAANHHPDIDIRYSKVTLTLSTHDAGGLTRKDFDLATRIQT